MAGQLFPHICQPGPIGRLTLKNRIVGSPFLTALAETDGRVSERLLHHYRELAGGGAGLLIVENAFTDAATGRLAEHQLGISDDNHLDGLRRLAETIRDAGAAAGILLQHCGRQKPAALSGDTVAASPLVWEQAAEGGLAMATPHEATGEEISRIIEQFAAAADRAKQAGFDMIELQAGQGYLITNFLSPHTNKRSDGYGGDLSGRLRLLVEIIAAIRDRIGADMPLSVRLSGTDYEPDGIGIWETIDVCRRLETLGVDAVHISGGDNHQIVYQISPMSIERGGNIWAAEAVRQHVAIPVIATGSITLPDFAEEILASEKADFIGLRRSLWADPAWPEKACDDRPDDIRPCIRCNEGCLENVLFRNRPISCTVNATIGREAEATLLPTETRRRVVIIGGGPAGLEAARVCALRGHEVTLYEKRKLGGMLNESGIPEFKSEIRLLRDYLIGQVKKLNVTIVSKMATISNFDCDDFDAAIIANGAEPRMPVIPGIEQAYVFNAVDVYTGRFKHGWKIAVIGGGRVGVETAIYLAEQGRQVIIIETTHTLMADCTTTDRIAYRERLTRGSVDILLGTNVDRVGDRCLTVSEDKGPARTIAVDTVILAIGYQPRPSIGKYLRRETDMVVHEIGDCVRPGKIIDAVHSAYETGQHL